MSITYEKMTEGPVSTYRYQGRNASISKELIDDQKINVSNPFWFQGVLYRPIEWDLSKERLYCRILEAI